MKSLIIIPTYNERRNIELLISKISELKIADILVIDDNSPDGTGELVEKLKFAVNPVINLEVIHRNKKLGLGTGYITGFEFAIKHNYERIVMMDADLSHNPEYIPEFFNKLKEFSLVIGSRYVSNGGIVGWQLYRKLLSRFGNFYARTITCLPIKDCTSGFMALKSNILLDINYNKIRSEGYGFLIELKYRIFKKGYKFCELPIVFTDRTAGKSKISKKIIFEAMGLVFKLRFFGSYNET